MTTLKTDSFRQWLDKKAGAFASAVTDAVRKAANQATADARATTQFKDRTGNLRRSIRTVVLGPYHTQTIADGNAAFIEYGTKAHVITPRNGQFLVFQMNGSTIFARSVKHPGTAPHPFMAPARARAIPFLHALLAKAAS